MGKNFRRVDRGYSRSREKELTQALVEEDYYEAELESPPPLTTSGPSEPTGPADLMAEALDREVEPTEVEEAPSAVVFRERSPAGPSGLGRWIRRVWGALRKNGA